MRAARQSRTAPFISTRLLATTALAAVTLMAAAGPARAVDDAETPMGEHVVGGSASFERPEAGLLNVKQGSNRVVIDWNSFNIGKNAKTEFFQPNSKSLAVNRVTGKGDDPSQILGTLKANGNVMILDRNGVLFGADSTIDVNGIVASTGNINVDDVMSGADKVVLRDFGNGAIVNNGTVNAGEAGLVAFVAPTVVNNGVINAKLGKVALAGGGESATVDLYGDGLVELALNGKASKAVIENTGSVNAEGGTVLMTAAAAKDVVDGIINTSGIVKVSSAEVSGGKIILRAGKVDVSGNLEADGKTGGGSIDVKGSDVAVAETATISADATGNGNGGTINLIADQLMTYRGLIAARGGAEGGNGGFAEISGYNGLIYEGLADMTAANGAMGNILLDPRFTIIHSGILLPGIFQQYALSSKVLALNLRTANVTVQADDFIDVGTSETPYNLAITGNAVTDAALNLFLNGLSDGNIDLSTWNFLLASGKTAGSLTLQSDVVNFNRDLKMGKGNLTVDAGTINLDGVIRGLNAAGTSTVLFDETRMSSNTLALSVLSNEAMIQQAIDLAASGATIGVAAGDYAESLDVYKSLTLNGANQGLAGTDGSRTAETRILPNSPGMRITADNVTVDGFTIDGADNGILVDKANSATLKNNIVTSSSMDGIHATGGAGITIENNLVDGTGDDGIQVEKNTGTTTISGNTVRSAADEGIEVRGGNIAKGSGAVVISKNIVDGNSGTGVHGDGIQVARSTTSMEITGNTVTGTSGDGVEVHSTNGGSITGNILSGNGDQGIEISEGSDGLLVDGNDISDSDNEGIYVDGGSSHAISNNDIESSGKDGIHADNVGMILTISGNAVIDSDGDGISTDHTGNTMIDGNIVILSRESGIQSSNAGTIHIGNNGIGLAGDNGIHVYDSGYEDSESGWGVEIVDNDVVLTGYHGIYVGYSGSTRIAGNEVALAGTDVLDWGIPGFENHGDYEGYAPKIALYDEIRYDEGDMTLYWGDGDGIHVDSSYRRNYDDYDYKKTDISSSTESTGETGGRPDLLITGNDIRWTGGDGIDVRDSGITEISGNNVSYNGIDSTTLGMIGLEDLAGDLMDLLDEYEDEEAPQDAFAYEASGDESIIDFLVTILPEAEFTWQDGHGIYVADTGYPYDFYSGDFSGFDGMTESGYSVRILGNTADMTGGDGIESYYNGWTLISRNTVDNAGQQFIDGGDGDYEEKGYIYYGDYYDDRTGDGIRVDNGTVIPSYGDFSVARVTGNTVTDSYEDNIHVIDVNRSSIDGNSTSFGNDFAYGENNIVVEADVYTGGYPSFGRILDYPYGEGSGEDSGYDTWIVGNTSVDNAPRNGILIDSIDNSVVSGNIVSNSGANGLFVSGPDNGTILVAGNDFIGNTVGARFESGLIDLTGETNHFTGGDVGLLFAPAFTEYSPSSDFLEFSLEEGEGSGGYAFMALAGDTIGTSVFTGQSTYYVELANGAFFAPGLPTLLNGNDATFDGLTPGLTGGVLSQAQYDALEAMLYHYNDDATLGLFFFEIGEDLFGINQEDVFNQVAGFNAPNPGLRVTITGLPSLPGQGGGQGGGTNTFDLANIEPAAGGNNPPAGDQSPQDIEPAAGGQSSGQGTENGCWGDAIAGLSSGQASTLNYGSTPDEALNGESACQNDI